MQQDHFNLSLHASLGISILALSLVRIWWRWTHAAPALPAKMKNWEKKISHITHIAFYVLMIALPLSGLMAFTGEAVKDAYVAGASIFGVFSVPALPDFAGIAGGLHGLGAKLGQVLVILHVLAALKHQFWNKDNLFKRMSPL